MQKCFEFSLVTLDSPIENGPDCQNDKKRHPLERMSILCFQSAYSLGSDRPGGIAVLTISNDAKHRGLLRRKSHGPSIRRRELIIFKIPVPFPGHLSQSGPQPAGVLSEQQQSYLVMFVGD